MPAILVVFACVCIFSSQAFGTKELIRKHLKVPWAWRAAHLPHQRCTQSGWMVTRWDHLRAKVLKCPGHDSFTHSDDFLLISELLIQFHQCLQFRYIRYHFIVWLWPLDWLRLWNLAACNCILTKKEPRRSSFRPRPANWMGNFD